MAPALLLLLPSSACSGEGGDGSEDDGSPGTSAKDLPQVETETTVDKVSGQLDERGRAKVKQGVNAAVDQWFDEAFLGEFPRTDYSAAFAGFTRGAQEDAERDLDLMSNARISDQIETAVAVNRRVRLNVLAPQGQPRGATARFVLDFTTTGELAGDRRVIGSLYLSKQLGEWRVFGYDVLEAMAR